MTTEGSFETPCFQPGTGGVLAREPEPASGAKSPCGYRGIGKFLSYRSSALFRLLGLCPHTQEPPVGAQEGESDAGQEA